LGNEELVVFAPLELRHRNRRRQVVSDLEWVRRTAVYEPTDADRRDVEAVLNKKDLDLLDMHRVATLMEAAKVEDALTAVRVLEKVWTLDDGQLRDETLKILRRAEFSSHPEVRRRAFQILMHAEPLQIFSDTLSSFLDSPSQVFDADTISILAERDLESQRLDALIRETERRCHGSKLEYKGREGLRTATDLIAFLSEFGALHPSHYRRLRGFITRMSVEPSHPEIKQQASNARRRLDYGFRAWLGPASRLAVDPETAREYRWEDVVEFSDDVDEEAKRRLLEAFKATPMLREAVFLFSDGIAIRLDDILPNGVWVRLLGTDHGKSVYRVAVKTRLNGQFDLTVNLNRSLSPDQVSDEVDWLIICGESPQRSPLVERFGGYWPGQDLWTEEFVAGETLDRALKRLARQKHNEERYLSIWPYAAWSALSAHVDLWRRTGKADPTPANVIVPMHDYHTGARLVSIAGRRSFSSFYELLASMKHDLVEAIEEEHDRLRGAVGWDIVFSAVLEVVGEMRSIELLESSLADSHRSKDLEFQEALQGFVGSVRERGFLPMRLFFAAKRYRRWMRLNPDATVLARARTLQEIYDTYNLNDLQASYPEVRARFFLDTIFRESDPPLVEGLKSAVQRLRRQELEPDALSFAVADLRSRLKLSVDEDYFLTRLSYPYLQPEDEAEFVPAEVGGSQQSEMVVTLEDSDGNPYRIRHALNPKEVGRLHGLFLNAKLPVQFRPDHRFLVALSERGHLIGGLFYEVDFEAKTAYMDKIVVSDRFQRKGVAGAVMEELSNRLKTAGYLSLTTGFFRPQFFYRYGFTVEKNYAGLVRSLVDKDEEIERTPEKENN
jgi:GNAT superfamily N-acetyltransferase